MPYQQGYGLACSKLGDGGGEIRKQENAGVLVEAIHPASLEIRSAAQRLFFIVTPVLNGERFISITLKRGWANW